MAFSYTEGSPADADRLRLILGDVVEAEAEFSDAEITDLLARAGSLERGAVFGFDALMAKWARQISFSADGASFQLREKMQNARHMRGIYLSQAVQVKTVTPVDGYSDDVDVDDTTSQNFGIADDLD